MIPDLPHDLETEILCRIPATFLSQRRSTCKRWYALFKDPKFFKKNLNLGKAAREVIILTNSSVHSIIVNLHGIPNNIDPSVEYTGYGNNNSSSHSYKILMFYGIYNEALDLHVVEYEIYEFSSDTWRVLDDATHNWYICSIGVTFKGNVYGIAFDKETGYFMLKFDFTTERFGCLPLPYQSYDPEDAAVSLSVVREEKLSVLQQNFDTSDEMKIWVTNKIDDEAKEVSWSKLFVVDLQKFKLPTVTSVMSFLVDEENKMVLCCDNIDKEKIYIVGKDIYREVYKETTKGLGPVLVSYVPTLVQIPKKTQNGKRKRNT